MVKTECFSPEIGKKTGCLLSLFLFNVLEVITTIVRQEKEIKRYIVKEGIKQYL